MMSFDAQIKAAMNRTLGCPSNGIPGGFCVCTKVFNLDFSTVLAKHQ